jgi:hypothetical protein
MVSVQSRQGVHKTSSKPIAGHGGTLLSQQPMQEAEIKRITFPGQLRQKKKKFGNPPPSQGNKSWARWHMLVIPEMAGTLK